MTRPDQSRAKENERKDSLFPKKVPIAASAATGNL